MAVNACGEIVAAGRYANADNNNLAVFNVSNPGKSQSKGFIPTRWCPTCVRVVGNRLCVTNRTGLSSFANPAQKNVEHQKGEEITGPELYIGSMFKGALSIIPIAVQKVLDVYSRAYIKIHHLTKAQKLKNLSAKPKSWIIYRTATVIDRHSFNKIC